MTVGFAPFLLAPLAGAPRHAVRGARRASTRGVPTLAEPRPRRPSASRAAVAERTRVSFVGTPAQVRDDLEVFTKATGVDEVIVTCGAFDPEIRKRSLELLADVWS